MIEDFSQPRMHQLHAHGAYVYGQRMYVLRQGRRYGMTESHMEEVFVPTEVTLTTGQKAYLVIGDVQLRIARVTPNG